MLKYIVGVFSLTMLLSCQPEGRVYNEFKVLSPNLEWLKKDVRVFSIPVSQSEIGYNLSLSFRHSDAYMRNNLKVKITETSPSGVEKVLNHTVKLKDESGKFVGEPGFDIWDVEDVIESNYQYLEIGTYEYKIEHQMIEDQLHYAMDIGLILDEVIKLD
ncbi:MAG: gliding motility-associated lipoprotein GldH [Patiriisocius sp.]|jgi:gliding motility-associated lipoprotein GldH